MKIRDRLKIEGKEITAKNIQNFDSNRGGSHLPKFLRNTKEYITHEEREKIWENMVKKGKQIDGIVIFGDRQFVPLERYEALKQVADLNAQVCKMQHISRKHIHVTIKYRKYLNYASGHKLGGRYIEMADAFVSELEALEAELLGQEKK